MTTLVTTINIHHVHRIAARSQQSTGAPVTLRCAGTGNNADTEITIYLGDQALADRLVASINHAMRPVPHLPLPDMTAANQQAADYVGELYSYKGLAR
jgi:hypothetical protein